ncbi:MAG: sigma-54-dependent transcriptional regulator [Planctomycetota bacterium]|jgi:DNA-binding NtrC family response regulator
MTQTDNNTFYQALILTADSKRAGTLLEVLAKRSLRGTVAVTLKSAKMLLDRHHWNLIFLSTEFGAVSDRNNGFEIVRHIRQEHPEMPIVMSSPTDSSEHALKAMRFGCVDFLTEPLTPDAIHAVLDTYLPNHPTHVMETVYSDDRKTFPIIGTSAVLRETVQMARSVARTAAPVLISGPSGTGKELIAQLVHNHSRRCDGPFVQVNCAALNESLLESELFGHERGAFTGAVLCHQGRLERAHGGTLLLDEITETPPAFQAKLLRALEQMSFERVGGHENIHTNVRIISTTNQDIHHLVQSGRFRADLYYRLAAVRLQIPSLLERREDLPDLIWWFVNQFAHEAGREITAISRQTFQLFQTYHWPGNIRQLRNMVRTAMILGQGSTLCVTQVPWLVEEMKHMPQGDGLFAAQLGQTPLQEIERQAILATLTRADGNQAQAARVLGISDRTLREKVKKYRQHEFTMA